jgi:hypothetical protein
MFLVEKDRFQLEQQVMDKTLAYVKSLLVSRKEWKAKQDAKANQPQPMYGPSFFLSHSPPSSRCTTAHCAPHRVSCLMPQLSLA